MNKIIEQNKQWIDEVWQKIDNKISKVAVRSKEKLPYTTDKNGVHNTEFYHGQVDWWTNGFWPGMMWLMYIKTGDEMFRKIAEECEDKMDIGLGEKFFTLHHDVGFMWSLSAVASYKLTGNRKSQIRASHAASILASRFNPCAQYIRAWEGPPASRAIIDCIMNIPILEWASKFGTEPGPRYAQVARLHADTVLRAFLRPDGSVNHFVHFDTVTGEVLETPGGQGYESGDLQDPPAQASGFHGAEITENEVDLCLPALPPRPLIFSGAFA